MVAKLKYRCGRAACRAIYHLSKPPEQYAKTKKCRCGGTLHDYSCDRRRNSARTCTCDGWSFPHHSGAAPWCRHSKREPTNEEYERRYGL